MEAIVIINPKSKEILLTKQLVSTSLSTIIRKKINTFIQSISTILSSSSPSPFLSIADSTIVYLLSPNKSLIYIAITSSPSTYIPSILSFLNTISTVLTSVSTTEPTPQFISDNIVLILLMIDHFISASLPIINNKSVLSSLITPYALTDKISEKIIGLAKSYDSLTLEDYLEHLQINGKEYEFHIEKNRYTTTILFDYIDNVNVVVDKKTTVLRNTVFSKININATTMENHPLNILLNIPFTIGAMSIDNSISTPLKEIKKKKTIDCISKHGQYTLLNMEAKLSSSFIKIPFVIQANSEVNDGKVKVNIEIECCDIQGEWYDIEDIAIDIFFNVDEDKIVLNSDLSVNEGEFYFEKNKARWRLNSISKGEKVVMKGNLITKSKSCICIMNMRAKIEKYSVSGGSLVKVNLIEKDVDKVEKFFKRKTVIQYYEMMF